MTVTETAEVIHLSGGPVAYVLRRSPRARGLRVVIQPDRGVLVTVPYARRRGWSDPHRHVHPFLVERERWLRRHLARQARELADLFARGGLRDGALIRFRGEFHRLRIEPAIAGRRRASVQRVGGVSEDELLIRMPASGGRPLATVLEQWLRDQARREIERMVAQHTEALGVTPAAISIRDQRTRWGSASRKRRLAFSWRLILAPPQALETVVIHELAHLRVFGHGPAFWSLVATRRPDHASWRRWLRDHLTELHLALGQPIPALDRAS